MDAVGGRRPHPATRIHGEAVRVAVIGMAEEAAVAQAAVLAHVERLDLVQRPGVVAGDLIERQRGVGHVERPSVGGKGEPVGLLEIGHPAQFAAAGIETINAAMVQFGFGQAALARHQQAENGVGEPDRAVAGDSHVIGRIQPLAFEMRDDRFGLAVAIGTADAAPPVLAMHEVAVRLERVAVHEIGAIEGDGHLTARVPGEQAPVRHV